MERCCAAIDLKSFYASVECVERGLDPLTTNLVVADARRTEKTICLAVSPSLKRYGLSGRSRLFEVVEKAKEVQARTGRPLEYIVAPPRMRLYMEYSGRIYQKVYLKYLAPEDIHVYSIDEVFLELTHYLHLYQCTPHELVRRMIGDILRETGVTATGGIGTNLYLAKIAMDIQAKHAEPDADGVRIAELDEISFRERLWNHRPLTDFWRIGRGTVQRLERLGVTCMGELARLSLTAEDTLYRVFGVDAELLIDHAWGVEPCTIADIKAFVPEDHSISVGQVLPGPYPFAQGRIIVQEMAGQLAMDLTRKGLVTDGVTLTVVYDKIGAEGNYAGLTLVDRYGITMPKPVHGTENLLDAGGFPMLSDSVRRVEQAALAVYDRLCDRSLPVRRFYLVCNHVRRRDQLPEQTRQMDFFSDPEELSQERETEARDSRMQQALLGIQERFGANAVLRALSYQEGATARERSHTIGGHAAGDGLDEVYGDGK